MKVLIVYESVSPSHVTARVAENIRRVLVEKGVEVDSFSLADADKAVVKDYTARRLVHPRWRSGRRKDLRSFWMACHVRVLLF